MIMHVPASNNPVLLRNFCLEISISCPSTDSIGIIHSGDVIAENNNDVFVCISGREESLRLVHDVRLCQSTEQNEWCFRPRFYTVKAFAHCTRHDTTRLFNTHKLRHDNKILLPRIYVGYFSRQTR